MRYRLGDQDSCCTALPAAISSAKSVVKNEGAGMKLINTDGMSFIGPGSEWFWTMLQVLVVAVSLLGLYRQLRLQARPDVAGIRGPQSNPDVEVR